VTASIKCPVHRVNLDWDGADYWCHMCARNSPAPAVRERETVDEIVAEAMDGLCDAVRLDSNEEVRRANAHIRRAVEASFKLGREAKLDEDELADIVVSAKADGAREAQVRIAWLETALRDRDERVDGICERCQERCPHAALAGKDGP